MKKLILVLSFILLPLLAFAQPSVTPIIVVSDDTSTVYTTHIGFVGPTVSTSGYKAIVTGQGALINSAGLAAALSDETGTGLAVFATSPTLTTPDIGAATATSVNGLIPVAYGANPTVDAAGKFSIDNSATSGSAIRFYGDATYTLPAWQRMSFVIIAPVATDDYSIGSFPANITIKQIRVLCLGGTNIIGGLDEGDANGANIVAVDSDITASAGTTATDDGTLTNPTIDANDQLNWHTTSISGTPTAVTVTVYYVYDAVN